MIKEMAITALGAHLPSFDPRYSYHLEWLFEEDHARPCWAQDYPDPKKALDAMITIWNTPKTLVHISLSRRNA